MLLVWFLIVVPLSLTKGHFGTSKCQNLMWLHPPKTSSAFCTTISHVCCPVKFQLVVKNLMISVNETYAPDFYQGCALPSIFRGTGLPSCVGPCKKHVPYPIEHKDKMRLFKNQSNIIAVTIMRQPVSRLISSFFDGGGHWEGFGTDAMSKLLQQWATYSEEKEQLQQTTIRKALDYIYHPRMTGCVTKMLLGYQCYSDYLSKQSSFNETALHEAKQRLRQFFFVGIVEQYEESIRLFHIAANVSTQPHWTELRKQRVTKVDAEIRSIIMKNVTQSFVDPYDDELYALATTLYSKTKRKLVQWR